MNLRQGGESLPSRRKRGAAARRRTPQQRAERRGAPLSVGGPQRSLACTVKAHGGGAGVVAVVPADAPVKQTVAEAELLPWLGCRP